MADTARFRYCLVSEKDKKNFSIRTTEPLEDGTVELTVKKDNNPINKQRFGGLEKNDNLYIMKFLSSLSSGADYTIKFTKIVDFGDHQELKISSTSTMDDILSACRKKVLEAVKKNRLELGNMPHSLKNDREIVTEAVINNGLAFKFASPELRNNFDIVRKAMNSKPQAVIQTLSTDMKKIVFMYSVTKGKSQWVELLLEEEDVDPNMKDITGKTALIMAAEKAAENKQKSMVVDLLLSHQRVNPNIRDLYGKTGLYYAQEYAKRINDYAMENILETQIELQEGIQVLKQKLKKKKKN